MFSGSNFSMALSVTLTDKTGSQKSKMVAEIKELHASHLTHMIAKKVQRLYPYFKIRQHGETSGDTVRRLDMSKIEDGDH